MRVKLALGGSPSSLDTMGISQTSSGQSRKIIIVLYDSHGCFDWNWPIWVMAV